MSANSKKLPAAFLAGSFLCILGLVLFTNPVSNLGLSMLFFLAFWVLTISVGYLITIALRGGVGVKAQARIVIVGILLTLLIMFRSSSALGWFEGLILLLITIGLIFYSSRRI